MDSTARRPLVKRRRNASTSWQRPEPRQVGGHRAHHRHRHHGVGHLHERVGVGVRRHGRVALGADGQGQHDVTGRSGWPRRSRTSTARGEGRCGPPRGRGSQREADAAQAGPGVARRPGGGPGRATPAVVPEPEQDELVAAVTGRRVQGRVGRDVAEPEQHGDADEVVGDRHPGRARRTAGGRSSRAVARLMRP